jgi:glycosyltransferase involved in cell wall biosynthesis
VFLKILYVVDSLGAGGAERAMVNLLPEFSQLGVQVVVAILRAPLDLAEEIDALGVTIERLNVGYKWNLFCGVLAIKNCAEKHGVDVVHAHLFFPTVYVGLARYLGIIRQPTVVTFHNLGFKVGVNPATLGAKVRKLLSKLSVTKGFSLKLAVSDAVAQHYGQHLGLNDVTTVYNPIPCSELEYMPSKDLNLNLASCSGLMILLPGRLVKEKGHAVFIEAIKELQYLRSDFKVIIAGWGPLRQELERQVEELGLSEIIEFTGRVEYRAMLNLMRRAGVVVVPSTSEGFGMTAAEALSVGTPVIASRVGGLVEILGEGEFGVLVEPGDSESLKNALVAMIDDELLRRQYAKSGVEKIRKTYSSQVIAARLVREYCLLVNN